LATSVSAGVPCWVDTPIMDASSPFRTYDIGTRVFNGGTAAANQVPGGVFPGNGAMAITAAGGMNIQVSAGYCCVPNSSSALQGGYVFGVMSAQTLTLAAASLTLPRIDIIVAGVNDTGLDSSGAYVQIEEGTPAATPSVPIAPANSITLAQIAVGASVTSVTSANITDVRTWVVAPGGILPIASESAAPAAPASQFMYNLQTNALVTGSGTAGVTGLPSILPWAPQVAVKTSNTLAGSAGALVTVLSVNVTTDGQTDIEMYLKWAGVQGSASYITIGAYIDGTLADSINVESLETTTHPTSGGSVKFYSSSAGSPATPTAGTHTVTFRFQAGGTGTSASDGIVATATAATILRVAPVAT
jgi:hypothetical protein